MNVTAVVLSAHPYEQHWNGVDEVLVHRSIITDAAQLQAGRFDALAQVKTSHFFYLDDDDELPENISDVLTMCLDTGSKIVYTDEWITRDGVTTLRRGAPYSRDRHLRDATFVHHLVVCDTAAARQAISMVPRGHYSPEFLLYWQLATLNGKHAEYVPEPGYIWNRGNGIHTWPATSLSQMRATLWCNAHQD